MQSAGRRKNMRLLEIEARDVSEDTLWFNSRWKVQKLDRK
jgi:hypothetical protein